MALRRIIRCLKILKCKFDFVFWDGLAQDILLLYTFQNPISIIDFQDGLAQDNALS